MNNANDHITFLEGLLGLWNRHF